MTVRRLHLGDFHPNLETAFAQSLADLCPQGDARGVLVVVPNGLLGTHLRRRAAELGTATIGLEPRTLEDLSEELAAPVLAARGARRLEDWATPLVLAGIVAGRDQGPWRAVHGPGETVGPGWSRALAATVRDLRDALVEPRALAAALDAAGLGGSARLRAVAEVYGAYVARLRRRPGLADAAAMAEAALEALDEAGPGGFAPRAVLVYGFYDVVARQRRVLERLLAARDRHAEAFFPWGAGPAFEYTGPMRRWFVESMGFEVWHGDPLLPCSNLITLRHRVFGEPSPDSPQGDGSVRWLSAPTESGEAVEVLRRLAASPSSSTIVILRQKDPGAERFRAAARASGVALHIENAPLDASAPGRAAAALLRLARERGSGRGDESDAGLPRAVVEELLVGGGLAPEVFPAGSRPERWIQALRGRGLVAGLASWKRFVDRHSTGVASAQGTLPFSPREAKEPFDDEERERDARLARELPALADWVARLLAATAALAGESRSWARRVETARGVFAAWLAPSAERDRLLAGLAGLAALDGVLAPSFTHFVAAWEELAAEPAPPEAGPVRARFGDAPTVATLAEVRGVTAERVVLPGLSERSFPRRALEDPLLLDEERHALNASLGRPLPLKKEGSLDEERLLFRLALGAARREIVFSWPRRGEEGRPIVPSSFLVEAAGTLLGRPVRFDELDDPATEAGGALGVVRVPLRAAELGDRVPLLGSEFDLETAARLLRSGDASALAALAAAHPGFAAGLLAEERRRGVAHRQRLSRHDGLVAPALAAAWLDRRREPASGAPRLSSSALESYARCSFHFFQGRVLGLVSHPPPERRLDLDPRTSGSIDHAALRALFERILAADLWPLSDPTRLERAAALVEPILDELFERRAAVVEDLPVAMAAAHRRRAAEDLLHVLRLEAADAEGWRPRHLELDFGSAREPAVLEMGGARLALRGRIDRVDEGPLGARIVDYKTGRFNERWASDPGSVRGGERLQLPLYRRAYLDRLAARGEPAPAVHGAYRGVSRASEFHTSAWSPEDFAAAEAGLERVVPAILAGVEAGEFFQVWRDTFCERICDFRAVCGSGLAALLEAKRSDPRVARAAEWRGLAAAATDGAGETPGASRDREDE